MQSCGAMSPIPAVQLPSLKPTFSDLTISFPCHTLLLTPSLVAQAVRQHILPNRRHFSVYGSLPLPTLPIRPLPADFRAEFLVVLVSALANSFQGGQALRTRPGLCTWRENKRGNPICGSALPHRRTETHTGPFPTEQPPNPKPLNPKTSHGKL